MHIGGHEAPYAGPSAGGPSIGLAAGLMCDQLLVPAREGRAVRVAAGQRFRITTPKGAQAADFFAYNAENVGEWLSANHTWVTSFCVKPASRRRFPVAISPADAQVC